MVDYETMIKNMKQKDRAELSKGDYPPFVDFDETPIIGGVLSELREIQQKDGRKSKVMTLTTSEGEKLSVGLSAGLSGLADMDGKYVVIKFAGMKKTGSFYMKVFDVWEKPEKL